MFRAVGIAQAILFASTAFVLAQGGATRGAPPPQVLGQTGTMYDGNNVNLKLPAEPNRYWVDLWAGASQTGNSGPIAGYGAVSTPRSLDNPTAGGQH